MIPDTLLKKFGGRTVSYKKGETIFHEGDAASNFFIVCKGKIKMVSISEDGREFVQGFFSDGESFGEPPFFTSMPYPVSALAVTASVIWKCPHDGFLRLLEKNFEVHLALTSALSGRLLYKSMMLSEIAINEAEHSILTLIRYMVANQGITGKSGFTVEATRQQLADMTGLRVETVIRSIKSLARKRLVLIDGKGKIHFTNTKGRVRGTDETH